MTGKHAELPPSDRELIELAAKAAGYKWRAIPERYNAGINALWLLDQDGSLVHTGWDPLEDDGAALKLAVKLSIVIDPYTNYPMGNHFQVIANVTDTYIHRNADGDGFSEAHNGDPYAATRRAIVRAAAEIAKAKGETK